MHAIADQLEEIVQRRYNRWKNAELPAYLSKELNELKSAEIIDRFYQDLQLEDHGIYGITGVGTNRMNIFTIRRVCRGLAEEIKSRGFAAGQRGIAIGYDSTSFSKGLAEQAALVLANHEVKCYLFRQPSPAGELAFAVRYLHAAGGLLMSSGGEASGYSGCTLYDEHGMPVETETNLRLARYMEQWEDGLHIGLMNVEEAARTGRLVFTGEEVASAYLEDVDRIPVSREINQIMGASVRILYIQPGQGEAGLLRSTLLRSGFTSVHVVQDPKLQSAKSSSQYFELYDWRLANEAAAEMNADLILAFNPQYSELALSIKTEMGKYLVLSHSETAALLLHYLLRQKNNRGGSTAGGVLLKSFFTSDLASAIARKEGIKTINVTGGFGGGASLGKFCRSGNLPFLFGYDEDGGFAVGGSIAGSDAIQYAVLIAEMSAYFKSRGRTLGKELLDLYAEHGWFADDRIELTYRGLEGRQRVSFIMGRLSKDALRVVGGLKVEQLYDFRAREHIQLAKGKHLALDMPRYDALKFIMEDGSWYGLRPVSAQPGIQLFLGSHASDSLASRRKLAAIRSDVLFMLESML
ncbi:hypothetical protein [Paenibacillus sp. IHBB 3054]|uniref:hypothetical protein n=1 Tax=Paenibacillus sp. IHBB 3054 TaxID=3425689 RepID=UPI003F667A7C